MKDASSGSRRSQAVRTLLHLAYLLSASLGLLYVIATFPIPPARVIYQYF